MKGHTRAQMEDPRALVSLLPRLGERGREVPIRVERDQRVVDVAVGARLHEAGLEEWMEAGWVRALRHDQSIRWRGSVGPGQESWKAACQNGQRDPRAEARE